MKLPRVVEYQRCDGCGRVAIGRGPSEVCSDTGERELQRTCFAVGIPKSIGLWLKVRRMNRP